MIDLTEFLRPPRRCPDCGAANFRSATYCAGCGERIRNRNPFVRFLVTVAAMGIVIGVIWYKLKW